jgi:C4-dicarboxylate-binding protein DctP
MQAIKTSGLNQIIPLTAEEKQAWRTTLKPVYQIRASRVGQTTIDEFEKEANAVTH